MPGIISRDGTVMVMPEFSQQQKDDMARAIARAMVSLSREKIRKAVEDYQRQQEARHE